METADLRAGALQVAAELGAVSSRWILLGVGTGGCATSGTFRGFGADVRVTLGQREATEAPDPLMPLPALVGGWLRSNAAPHAEVEPRLYADSTEPGECARIGRRLRAEIEESAGPVGVLVVADGANTLSATAPGSLHPGAPALQGAVDAALSGGDVRALAALDPEACAEVGMGGRVPWQILAALFADGPSRTSTAYSGAPYGVGYHVGMWWP